MVVGDRGDDGMDCHVQCSLYFCPGGRRDIVALTCRVMCAIYIFPSLVSFCSNLDRIFVFGDRIHAAMIVDLVNDNGDNGFRLSRGESGDVTETVNDVMRPCTYKRRQFTNYTLYVVLEATEIVSIA